MRGILGPGQAELSPYPGKCTMYCTSSLAPHAMAETYTYTHTIASEGQEGGRAQPCSRLPILWPLYYSVSVLSKLKLGACSAYLGSAHAITQLTYIPRYMPDCLPPPYVQQPRPFVVSGASHLDHVDFQFLGNCPPAPHLKVMGGLMQPPGVCPLCHASCVVWPNLELTALTGWGPPASQAPTVYRASREL